MPKGQMAMDDTFVRDTPSTYGDFRMEKLLGQLGPKMEFYTGLPLYPTYSFARVYKKGDVLKPHRDRPACEVSISLNLGQTPDEPWPLYLRDHDNNVFGAMLRPGDALIYRGIELAHWRRKPSRGEKMAQVFLHYVDRNGPNAAKKFDGRAGLGLPRRVSPDATEDATLPSPRLPPLLSGSAMQLSRRHDPACTRRRALRTYLESSPAQGQMTTDTFVPRAPALLWRPAGWKNCWASWRPKVEFYTGLQLYPTYSYARIYKHGDQLTAASRSRRLRDQHQPQSGPGTGRALGAVRCADNDSRMFCRHPEARRCRDLSRRRTAALAPALYGRKHGPGHSCTMSTATAPMPIANSTGAPPWACPG